MASRNDASVEPNSVQENEKISLRRSFEEVIQKLEEVFSEMPNPETHVMEKLSEELELDITQIGIWFENKRYYIQAQKDMEEREIIRLENEKLRSENLQMCSEVKKRFCATCNNPKQQRAILQDLQNENAKLGEENTILIDLTMKSLFMIYVIFLLVLFSVMQTNHALRLVKEGGDEKSVSAAELTCPKSRIQISQAASGTINGIPEYSVIIINECESSCSGIHLSCGEFATTKLINPKIFRRLAINDCLVNDGATLKSGQVLSFTYSNSFKYPMSLSKNISPVSPRCCTTPTKRTGMPDVYTKLVQLSKNITPVSQRHCTTPTS
ncbi:hypothetical protein HAX54_021894 [Datura stramonium]|uniref:Homeobox domain-containing protein n=1 Tax=Datura stramonium TaxID=4076 RepID=A0ABS8S4F6_DATST|nr:hypothetical protein [Datura stramonium]